MSGAPLRCLVYTAVVLLVSACGNPPSEQDVPAFSSPIDALTVDGGAKGFARAETVREFVFPEDHGPHPEFLTEWWYFTGNLISAEGRRFGIQWTIFRRALAPEPDPETPDTPEPQSAWATRQLYMGHMALTDVESERHLAAERFARGAAGLAGAEIRPFRVWLEDWSATSEGDGLWPLTLTSGASTKAGDFRVELMLETEKPMVLQGDRGLSQKHEGGASYYYAFTRIGARGHIELDGRRFEVEGQVWFDREWSTSTLDSEQSGWDWFSLQLSDGRELMFYQLRQSDGSPHPMSAGSLIDVDGKKIHIPLDQAELEVLDRWRSPKGGSVYPSRWRLRIPEHGLDLEVIPVLEDQELEIAFRYWEGAVDVDGTADGRAVQGRGYVELVGYLPSET